MKNPFVKLVGEVNESEEVSDSTLDLDISREPRMEQKRVVKVGKIIEGGAVYIWKIFEDGVQDDRNQRRLKADPRNRKAVENEIREIEEEWGVES